MEDALKALLILGILYAACESIACQSRRGKIIGKRSVSILETCSILDTLNLNSVFGNLGDCGSTDGSFQTDRNSIADIIRIYFDSQVRARIEGVLNFQLVSESTLPIIKYDGKMQMHAGRVVGV